MSPLSPLSPIVVLVRPQMGENIGMSARAMGNCGLSAMRIVSPRDGWPSASALSAARGAVGIVEGARVFGSVGEAVADCVRVMATSARMRDRNVCVYSPEGAVVSMRKTMMGEDNNEAEGNEAEGRNRCCVLFGPENNGLENEDMSYADGIIRADLEEGCCSMNLAMAVFMFCWEWRKGMRAGVMGGELKARGEKYGVEKYGVEKDGIEKDGIEKDVEELFGRRGDRRGDGRGDGVARRGDIVRFLRRLEVELGGRGFYRGAGGGEEVRLNLRAMGMRAMISEQELRTLEGVLSALLRERGD